MASERASLAHAEVAPRPFFTPKTLADYLALSERTIRELIRNREIPSYKISGARRVDPADVDSYLEDRREDRAA